MQAVILCGGKGKRLKSKYKSTPKVLIKFKNKSNLEILINNLYAQGINEILLLTNYLDHKIKREVEKKFKNKNIKILSEKIYSGTGGALKESSGYIKKNFILVLGDIYTNFNFRNFIKNCDKKKSYVVVHPNSHPDDSDTVELNHKNKIIRVFKKKQTNKPNLAMAGIYLLNKKILNFNNKKKNIDLTKHILLKNNNLYAYNSIDYIKDYGSIKRLNTVRKDLKILESNSKRKSMISSIFVDRDGVMNRELGVIKKMKNFDIFDDSLEAINKLNRKQIPCFLVSNQAALSKKLISFKFFKKIHRRLEFKLSSKKAFFNDYSYCPNFKNLKFIENNFNYFSKFRKPNPGMILSLKKRYKLNLKKSYFIGDSDKDIATGLRAGCKTVLIRGPKLKNYKLDVKPDYVFNDLKKAINYLLRRSK